MTRQQIKSKVDRLGLTLLPKNQRLCLECKVKFQSKRSYGFKCRDCFLKRRIESRIAEDVLLNEEELLDKWIRRATNTVVHRSLNSDLTYKFMIELWNNQHGKCFYSNLKMIPSKYGDGRSPFSPSVDRIDSSKDYTKDNVVWCIWACNAGKNDMNKEQYIEICRAVVNNNINQ